MSDIPGDPGSQLPYQEFPPYYLTWLLYLIADWHFPDPGGLGSGALVLFLLV